MQNVWVIEAGDCLQGAQIIMTHYLRITRPLGTIDFENTEPDRSPINPDSGLPDGSRWLHVWHHEARRDLFTQRESLRQRQRDAIKAMHAPSAFDSVNPGHADYSDQPCTCPHCNGPLVRIPRRMIDLVTSMFISVSRYRCCSMDCGWEGNLRSKRHLLLIQGPW